MQHHFLSITIPVLLLPAISLAQPKIDPANLHERVIAVVPMIGAGTYADPRRPLFTPAPEVDCILSSFETRAKGTNRHTLPFRRQQTPLGRKMVLAEEAEAGSAGEQVRRDKPACCRG